MGGKNVIRRKTRINHRQFLLTVDKGGGLCWQVVAWAGKARQRSGLNLFVEFCSFLFPLEPDAQQIGKEMMVTTTTTFIVQADDEQIVLV